MQPHFQTILFFFFAAKEILYSTILKKLYEKAFGDGIKEQDKELKEILKELGGELSEIAEKGGEALDEIAGEIIQWIGSYDPVRYKVHRLKCSLLMSALAG